MPASLNELASRATRLRTLRWPTRLKQLMWTRLAWPPLETFTGPIDIAHGAFHLLPPARAARHAVTVFDLSGIRYPETHTAASVKTHARLLRHAIPRADALIAISESCKADLVALLDAPAEKVHVVHGGVSLEEFAGPLDPAALEAAKRKFGVTGDYFIHLSTIEPRKNIPRLLEAYARLRARHRDCPVLLLAGGKGWKYGPVFEAIARHGLEDAVIHTGYVSREDAVLLLRGAFACVYPSLYEGFGLPVLEAMAARVPVLTSNVSSLPEVVGDAGILVDPERVDAIEAGLEDLLQHHGAAVARADAGYERASRFTWRHSAAALVGVYRSLVGRRD